MSKRLFIALTLLNCPFYVLSSFAQEQHTILNTIANSHPSAPYLIYEFEKEIKPFQENDTLFSNATCYYDFGENDFWEAESFIIENEYHYALMLYDTLYYFDKKMHEYHFYDLQEVDREVLYSALPFPDVYTPMYVVSEIVDDCNLSVQDSVSIISCQYQFDDSTMRGQEAYIIHEESNQIIEHKDLIWDGQSVQYKKSLINDFDWSYNKTFSIEDTLKILQLSYDFIDLRKQHEGHAHKISGEKLANIAYLTPKKDTTSLSSLGYDYMLVDTWYLACYPCRYAFPQLKRIQNKYQNKNFSVVGINADNKLTDQFFNVLEKYQFEYPQLLTSFDQLKQAGIKSYPTFLIIDKKGHVLYTLEGYHKGMEEELIRVLDFYLNN